MSKHTNKETVDSILWDSRSMDISALHEKYGVAKGTIRAMLYRYGLKPQKPSPSRYFIPKEKLEAVLANGWMTIQGLEEALGCKYPVIKRSMGFHGLLRGRKPHTSSRLREGNRAFKVLGYLIANPEMTHEAVAKQFNCTRELVSQIEAMARKEGIIK